MKKSSVGYGACVISLAFWIFVAGCQRTATKTPVAGFIPPTEVPIPTATTIVVTTDPTPQINCDDVLSFTDDITIPDGTILKPGEAFTKKWQVRNNGSCNWTDKYSLHLISGDPLGSPESQSLFPARTGSIAPISMDLTASQIPGNYRTYWQAYNPDGEPFGDPIYVDIVVK